MGSDTVSDPKPIKAQLLRILDSPDFRATPRQKKFLKFVVQKVLDGQADEIKGYTVATDVFGRNKNFDPKSDPIVSIEAKRLRRALEHYYLVAGGRDPVRIDIPVGSYVPHFHGQEVPAPAYPLQDRDAEHNAVADHWPSVLIRPFHNFCEGKGPSYIAEGLTTELAIELSRYQDLRILMKPPGEGGTAVVEPPARFLIDGNIRCGPRDFKLSVQLFDQKTHRQIWGDVYECRMNTDDLMAFQQEVSQMIAARIAQDQGYIAQTLSLESHHKPPAEMETYEAILKFYKHDATFTPETLEEALAALEEAVVKEPECPQLWTFLGRLYADNYAMEWIERQTPIEKAIEYAERGVQMNPNNQRARSVLAIGYLLKDQLAEGLAEARKALVLNPKSLIFMDGIGHALALLGDWDDGVALMRRAITLNPYHRPYVYHVLCADRLQKEDYKKAYLETLNFRIPSFLWDPSLRAATRGHLGKQAEAKRSVADLLAIKPDFQNRGRKLIKFWAKPEPLVEGIIEGLGKAGLDIL
jgi:adenylate cyclase